jgi:hypothetical protein
MFPFEFNHAFLKLIFSFSKVRSLYRVIAGRLFCAEDIKSDDVN